MFAAACPSTTEGYFQVNGRGAPKSMQEVINVLAALRGLRDWTPHIWCVNAVSLHVSKWLQVNLVRRQLQRGVIFIHHTAVEHG